MNVHRFVLAGALALSSLPAACKSDDGDEATYSIDKLKDPATCKECHADHYREWSGSMHAYASKDPVFLAMNARGQRETHGELGQFCVKCHAPMAVEDGLLNDGGTNIGDLANEDQGITCYFCHNVSDVHGTSNNPLVLAKDNVMRGGLGDPLQNKAHKSAQSAFHDSREAPSAKLCGSCHDIVVPAHFAGAESDQQLERTFEEWTGSIYADPKSQSPNTCGASGCHMRTDKKKPIADYPGVPTRDVRHHHDFPGVDVALTDFPEKAAQLAAVDDFLSGSLLVSLCVSDRGFADVTVENLSGHNFPSGASQDRRAWVELHAYSDDRKTQEYFSRGAVPAGGAVTDLLATEPDLWLMRDVTTKKNGEQAHMFWDVANIERNTILNKVAILPTMAGYHQEAPARSFDMALNGQAPRAATLTVHMQPIGTDVLRDLVATGDLPAASGSAGDAGAMPALTMPTHDLIPNKDAGATVTIEWTKQRSLDSNNYKQAPGGGLLYCVDTSTRLPQQ